MTIKCCYCGGRGWSWVGVAGNAERVPCEACGETGRTRTNWWGVSGTLLLLVSMLATCAFILWATTAAFGQTAGSMTLKEFRAHPQLTKSALVAGAMATAEHLGLRCPDPQLSVAEYVSRLTWRKLDDQQPWVSHFFVLTTQQGCEVGEQSAMNPKEGA